MTLPGLGSGRLSTSPLWLDFEAVGFDRATLDLLAEERDEFESILGCPVRVGPRRDSDAAWVVNERHDGGVSLAWDPRSRTLTSVARNPGEVMESMQLLHTVVREPDQVAVFGEPTTPAAAARLILEEVLGSYPYFELRGIDRDRWAGERLREVPPNWEQFEPWAQEWLAELGDAHTAVINNTKRGVNAPYQGDLQPDGLVLESVPASSAAHAAGVRVGWIVTVGDPEGWLRTTGASPQQRTRVAARRAMAVTGAGRDFQARDPQGAKTVSWREQVANPVLEDVLDVDHAPDGTVAVALRQFRSGIGIGDFFDGLCREARPGQMMLLDLSGNTGGNLVLATGLRDRFLHERTRIGSIAFSTGRGRLAPHRERWAEPSSRPRWPGPLTIAVDSMTYSAAEDFVLGLQGLDHVTVVGERTGGGSGRPRSLPAGPGLTLRISTAITYDRNGHPIEFHGIKPD